MGREVMAKLYRKKPVVVEAVQFTWDNVDEVREFLQSAVYLTKSAGIIIRTLEGDMLAEPGDYIIRGIQGEHYPCKPMIFEATYEDLL